MAKPKGDPAARKARAERLEAEIAELAASPNPTAARPTSPRDFINQRMAELGAEKKDRGKRNPKK